MLSCRETTTSHSLLITCFVLSPLIRSAIFKDGCRIEELTSLSLTIHHPCSCFFRPAKVNKRSSSTASSSSKSAGRSETTKSGSAKSPVRSSRSSTQQTGKTASRTTGKRPSASTSTTKSTKGKGSTGVRSKGKAVKEREEPGRDGQR